MTTALLVKQTTTRKETLVLGWGGEAGNRCLFVSVPKVYGATSEHSRFLLGEEWEGGGLFLYSVWIEDSLTMNMPIHFAVFEKHRAGGVF